MSKRRVIYERKSEDTHFDFLDLRLGESCICLPSQEKQTQTYQYFSPNQCLIHIRTSTVIEKPRHSNSGRPYPFGDGETTPPEIDRRYTKIVILDITPENADIPKELSDMLEESSYLLTR